MRAIEMTVGNTPRGQALTWAYPYGSPTDQIYSIPTYALIVKGHDSAGRHASRAFEVFRFGVWKQSPTAAPTIVGLADFQAHILKAWLPDYRVHSAGSPENGAWQVFGNFLIHDGPDYPMSKRSVYASIGCLAICGGPRGFVGFNDFILELAAPAGASRAERLAAIGRSGKLKITYLKATRPLLNRYAA